VKVDGLNRRRAHLKMTVMNMSKMTVITDGRMMTDMNVDTELLREQIEYLVDYPWKYGLFPNQIEGIVSLLESILDQSEGVK
jgi:hypothetical protein